MANPLDSGSVSPEAPLQDAPPQRDAPSAPTQQQAPPPPSHAQTVAFLRHAHAIIEEIQTVLKDPATGKSDQKNKIIDAVTGLVSERMLTPAQAVMQLSQVPSDPLQQRRWLQSTLMQTVQAANAVVDHHAAGNDGSLDWGVEGQVQHPNNDDHMNNMAGLEANYARK